MKKIILFVCLCLITAKIIAQDSTHFQRLHISYLGEFITQPGLRLGYSHDIWKRVKIKKSNNKYPEGKPKEKSLFLLYQLGFYTKKKLYTSFPLSASIGYSKTKPKGLHTQFAFGLGYDRSFLKGITYQVNDNGEVTEKRLTGSGYVSSQYSYAVGIDLMKRSKKLPIRLLYKNSIWLKHGYNNTTIPQWMTEFEVAYQLNKRKNDK